MSLSTQFHRWGLASVMGLALAACSQSPAPSPAAAPSSAPATAPSSAAPVIPSPAATPAQSPAAAATADKPGLVFQQGQSNNPNALEAEAVMKNIQNKYPKLQITRITRMGLGGATLYEFQASGVIGYTDAQVNWILVGGELITGSGDQMVNITKEHAKQAVNNIIAGLPYDKMLKFTYGNGERFLVVFSDPDCPFCQQLEAEFNQLGASLNATVYLAPYPLVSLHPDADRKARYLWCTANPQQAWHEWMSQPTDWNAFAATHPAQEGCAAAKNVDAALELGKTFGFSATPTLLFSNGSTWTGAPSPEELNKAFAYIAAHPDAGVQATPAAPAADANAPSVQH